MNSITFEDIDMALNSSKEKFLYELLSERNLSISHKKLPSYEEHLNFIKNNPYYKWVIVKQNKILIGSIYINKNNSVSIKLKNKYSHQLEHVLNKFEDTFSPQSEIKSYRKEQFFFNVNPNDQLMIKVLESKNYKISQISYQKEI